MLLLVMYCHCCGLYCLYDEVTGCYSYILLYVSFYSAWLRKRPSEINNVFLIELSV